MIMKKMRKQNLTVSLFLNRDRLYLKIMEIFLYCYSFFIKYTILLYIYIYIHEIFLSILKKPTYIHIT